MTRPALAGLRVLECGQMVSAAYATKLLADLGAEVIKVEPPEGDASRRRGPFPRGEAHPERSGLFLYLNTNKRSVRLDLDTADGRTAFDALARRADLFVHNLAPRSLDAAGLAYERLAAANPRLVMTSITPFGSSGPRRDDEATALTLWNAGGIAYLNGSPEAEELP
ncbi:MAG: CoA transferase, partial [Candidatus Binatia bacterium]